MSSHAGAGQEGFLVERDESLVKRTQDVVIDRAAGEVGIEVLDLGAIAHVEDALAVAGLDEGFAARTTGDSRGGANEGESDRGVEAEHEFEEEQGAHRNRSG
jgi:hypothetical protein